jgi:hypothetical protein
VVFPAVEVDMQPFSSVRVDLLLPMLAFLAGACGDSRVPPTTPAVVTTTTSASQIFTQIIGYVSDTAARPLSDVRVEIVDQSQAVASTFSDGNGRFTFSGSFDRHVTGRATKEGYVTASESAQQQNSVPSSPSIGYVFFHLQSLAVPVNIDTGDYTLSVMADSACSDLPDDVRTRTYAATVRSSASADLPANTQYVVSVAGTTSWCCLGFGGFDLGVAGNYVAVTDDTGPEMSEHITPSRYVELNAWGGTTVELPTASTLSFAGDLNYCELKSGMGTFSCSLCQQNTRITLTRGNAPTSASLRPPRRIDGQ